MILVIMGVSGVGKSCVAQSLISRNPDWHFIEGDHYHSSASKEKMGLGIPLTDRDRQPWLQSIAEEVKRISLPSNTQRNIVIACSALKLSYREYLIKAINTFDNKILFVVLKVSRAELERRISKRYDHFMPTSLLDSQLATLELPSIDEHAVVINAEQTVKDVVNDILQSLESSPFAF